MAINVEQMVALLNNLGFYQFILPWLFIFAIVFGLLRASNLFGSVNQRVSAIVALVVAFFATAYAGPAMASFFIGIFSGASLIIAGILVILLFVFMLGYKSPADEFKNKGIMVIMIVIGIVLFIAATGAASGIGLTLLMSYDMIAIILVIIVLLAAVWLIVKEPGKEKEAAPKKD